MVEIISKSCAQFGDTNEGIFYIDVCNCHFDQCFLLAEISSEFSKKKLIIVIIIFVLILVI